MRRVRGVDAQAAVDDRHLAEDGQAAEGARRPPLLSCEVGERRGALVEVDGAVHEDVDLVRGVAHTEDQLARLKGLDVEQRDHLRVRRAWGGVWDVARDVGRVRCREGGMQGGWEGAM